MPAEWVLCPYYHPSRLRFWTCRTRTCSHFHSHSQSHSQILLASALEAVFGVFAGGGACATATSLVPRSPLGRPWCAVGSGRRRRWPSTSRFRTIRCRPGRATVVRASSDHQVIGVQVERRRSWLFAQGRLGSASEGGRGQAGWQHGGFAMVRDCGKAGRSLRHKL